MESIVDDLVAQARGLFFGVLVADDFDANHQAFSPDVADNLEALGPVSDLAKDVAAHFFRIGHQAAFDQVHGSQGRSDADGVATVGGSVRAGLPLHDAFFGNVRADRHATGNSLRRENDVWRDAGMIVCPPLSGAPHACLNFVEYQHNAVLVTEALHFLQEERRSGNKATFDLNRSDYNGTIFFRGEQALKNLLLEQFDNFAAASFAGVAESTVISIRIRNVLDASQQRPKVLALGVFGGSQRKRAQRASMEAAIEGDELVAARGITSELDGALDGFGAGVAKEHLVVAGLRHGGHQPLGELRHGPGIKNVSCNGKNFC